MILTRHVEITIVPLQGVPTVINPELTARIEPQIYINFQLEKQASLNQITEGSIDIYNLNDITAGTLDFREDINNFFFGARITVRAGFLEEGLKVIFTGVVVSSLTVKRPPEYVTEIKIRNNYQELRNRTVNIAVSTWQTKSSAILQAITQVGGIIAPGGQASINALLAGAVFEKNDIFREPFSVFINRFKQGYPRTIDFTWDDAGVNFYPIGKLDTSGFIKIINEATGLIGSPQATSRGVNFKMRLDGTLAVRQPISIQSEATTRLALASANPSATQRVTLLSITKIIHAGDNRDGEFTSTVETFFLDNIIQVRA